MIMKITLLAALIALTPFSAMAADKEVIKVNGTAIRQSEVVERLWKRYGPATLEEMVDELLLRQAAADQKIKADPKQVERKFERVKRQVGGGEPGSFERQLAENGTTVEKVKAQIAEELVLTEVVRRKSNVTVKDDEVKKAFDLHKEKLGTPPAVHLRHILVKTESEAKDIIAKVNGGGDFKKLAAEKSLAPTGKLKGGDYGFISRGTLPQEIDAIAFQMKPGELRALPTDRGWHVLQAVAQRAGEAAVFSKVREDLKELILTEKVKATLPAYLQELRSKASIVPQG
jgi:parvulin-like peptidyl-prolyl isomerase